MVCADDTGLHCRKSPRLKEYDYSSPGYYFVTICTQDKVCLFGNPGQLNSAGVIAEKGILEIEKHFKNVKVDKYVVMPNHVHMILALEKGSAPVPEIIGQYKSVVTREIHKRQWKGAVWQASFHDHIIRNQTAYEKIWLYIDANPVNWQKDCFCTE